MLGGDRTGPLGKGPGTGRDLGHCNAQKSDDTSGSNRPRRRAGRQDLERTPKEDEFAKNTSETEGTDA